MSLLVFSVKIKYVIILDFDRLTMVHGCPSKHGIALIIINMMLLVSTVHLQYYNVKDDGPNSLLQ